MHPVFTSTECGCQPVAVTASAMVAPSLRRRRSTSRACLVPDRVDERETVAFGFGLDFDLDLAERLDPAGLRPWSRDRAQPLMPCGAHCGDTHACDRRGGRHRLAVMTEAQYVVQLHFTDAEKGNRVTHRVACEAIGAQLRVAERDTQR